jgi:signal transduction histidine kinase
MLATITEMEEMLIATLAFARDEATREERRRIDLSALVTSIVDDMADAGMAVEIDPSTERIELQCKPVALRRAITNLIDNAIKYAGAARVSLAVRDGNVEFSVEDDGPGIPEAQLANVLQPFYRVEGSRSRETGGIGLGLAIASAIAEAHGGKLLLANRATGGLRAAIVLPH